MGIIIDTGFKLSMNNMSEVMALVEDFRPWITNKAQEKLDYFLEHIMKAQTTDQILEAWTVWDRLRKQKKSHLKVVNTDFELIFFPYQGELLGIVLSESEDWVKEWMKFSNAQDFSYFEDRDKPDNLTQEDWDKRYEIWNELVGNFPLGMRGFSVYVAHPEGPLPKQFNI